MKEDIHHGRKKHARAFERIEPGINMSATWFFYYERGGAHTRRNKAKYLNCLQPDRALCFCFLYPNGAQTTTTKSAN